jgi:hypothetical protein
MDVKGSLNNIVSFAAGDIFNFLGFFVLGWSS